MKYQWKEPNTVQFHVASLEMGTGRKRKNAGIGIDFKRAKHKVGKTLKKSSATDTTIKSQSIHVPDQSLAADKQDKAVTTRNLTLKVMKGV